MALYPTYVGAGAAAYNEYDLAATASSVSSVAGDLLICISVIVSQAGTITHSSGWTTYLYYDPSPDPQKFRISYKTAVGGVESVTATPSGTSAGQRHCTCVFTWRDVNLENPFGGNSNVRAASTANIGPITAVTGATARQAVIVYGSKMGGTTNWTSVDTLTGDSLTWVEDLDTSSAVSADLGLVVDHATWGGAAPTITDKTFTVTGGSAGLSAGGMILLNSYPLPSSGTRTGIVREPMFATPTQRDVVTRAALMAITAGSAITTTSALSEIFAVQQRLAIDLTGFVEVKLSGWHSTGTLANGKLYVQYTVPGTDQTVFTDLIVAANGMALSAPSSSVLKITAWTPIPAAARMMVVIRAVWSGGDDATGATIKGIELQWR